MHTLALELPITPQEMAIYFGPAVGLSLVLGAIAWRVWSKSSTAAGYWAAPVAIGIGAAISMLTRASGTLNVAKWKWPGLPPNEAESWLIYAGLAVAAIGLLDALVTLWPEFRALLMQLLGTAVIFLVLRPLVQHTWKGEFSVILIGTSAVASLALWLLIERTSVRHPDVLPPLILLITATALATFEGLSNSLDLSLRAGAIAATLGPIAVLALWRPRITLARGGAMAFTVLFAGVVAASYAYTPDLITWRLLVIAGAPFVGLALLWLPWRGWIRWAISLGPVIIALAIVIILAAIDFKHAQESSPW